MEEQHSILRLSNELLKEILDYLVSDPDRVVRIDDRDSLSTDSFRRPPPEPPSSQTPQDPCTDIDHFRLVCKRFAEVSVASKFSRIVARFSTAAFNRLEELASRPHIAKHARTFTFIIRSFHVDGRDNLEELFQRADASRLRVSEHIRRRDEQREIIHAAKDVRSLKTAMAAFSSLHHVKILRVQDDLERELLLFIDRYDDPINPLVQLEWKPACIRAVQTLGSAILETNAPVARFSGPQINPEAALTLQTVPRTSLMAMAQRLTCLEIHFDSMRYVNNEMRALSGVFLALFMAARNMEAFHLGFPSRTPLDLCLGDMFRNVYWPKLRAFGIQSWRLHADEIIDFSRRHRRTLRGLRLRDVLLKEGSRWQTVLSMLRHEMDNLRWVSLRRIDYSNSFDQKWSTGINITDITTFPDSDSGDDDGGDDEDIFTYPTGNGDDNLSSIGEESDGMSSHHGDEGLLANQTELVPDTAPSAVPPHQRWTMHDMLSEDVGDDGQSVTYEQRKKWEQWVVFRPRDSGSCLRRI